MRAGLVGWRGMVGSVLMQRMREERDFDLIEPVFFSTSQAGSAAPNVGRKAPAVKDAHDVDELRALDVIVSCQGGEYTNAVYPKLREAGWNGYWIDAASALRMNSLVQKFFSSSFFQSSDSTKRASVCSQYATCASVMPRGPNMLRQFDTMTS